MAKKYYAVKNGRKRGVLYSWDECKASVDGFPNAIYKSFSNFDDAYTFIYGDKKKLKNNDLNVFAYIDGSYDDSQKKFSYAGIIFVDGKKISFSKANDDKKLIELRNVAGELCAAMHVMNYAKENNIKEITIYYDYAGIEMWATNKWKANLEFTKKYALFSQEIMKDVNINFEKVKAHSGIKYNEEVDKLAKSALNKVNTVEVNEIINDKIVLNENEEEKNILQHIKGSKNLSKIYVVINDQIISSDKLLGVVKLKWKAKKRTVKEIQEIKSYYDAIKNIFVIMIMTEKDENIMIIESSELYGEK